MSCQTKSIAFLLCLGASVIAPLALAQPAKPAKPSDPAPAATVTATPAAPEASTNKGEEQALKWFRMLDSNKDGRLSKDETAWLTRFKPSLAEEFKAADANRDGYVTQEEIRALADRRRVEREARRKQENQARK